MKKYKKKLLLALCTAVLVFLGLFTFSHLVYHRSVMATLSEAYMLLIDRNSIYEQGEEYTANLNTRAVENLLDYEKPEGVTMHIPYRDTHEHKMQVYYFNEECFTDTLIIYIPGGGYLNNPLKYHWKIIDKLSSQTSTPVIMPVYLKVPNYCCDESYEAMREFYLDVASRDRVERILFIGDSSGGALALGLAQQIRDLHPEVLQPEELILIAPWMDVSMENEAIEEIAPVDPMLDMYGAVELGKMWAGERDVHDPVVSPIYGNFESLGHITLFIGSRDMLYPDIILFSQLLDSQGIEHTLIAKEGLNHPYPLFPIPEAAQAREIMIDIINEKD